MAVERGAATLSPPDIAEFADYLGANSWDRVGCKWRSGSRAPARCRWCWCSSAGRQWRAFPAPRPPAPVRYGHTCPCTLRPPHVSSLTGYFSSLGRNILKKDCTEDHKYLRTYQQISVEGGGHEAISNIYWESDREVAGDESAPIEHSWSDYTGRGARQYNHIPVLKCGCTGTTIAARAVWYRVTSINTLRVITCNYEHITLHVRDHKKPIRPRKYV